MVVARGLLPRVDDVDVLVTGQHENSGWAQHVVDVLMTSAVFPLTENFEIFDDLRNAGLIESPDDAVRLEFHIGRTGLDPEFVDDAVMLKARSAALRRVEQCGLEHVDPWAVHGYEDHIIALELGHVVDPKDACHCHVCTTSSGRLTPKGRAYGGDESASSKLGLAGEITEMEA